MQIPNEPIAGHPIPATWGAQVVRVLRAIYPRESADVLPQIGASGTKYVTKAQGGKKSSAVPTQPFQIIAYSSTQVRIITSTLANDVPDGFGPGDDPPYLLTVADGDIIYGCVTFDTTDPALPVTSRTLGHGDSLPDDDPSTATFYERIGSVSISDAGVITPSNDRYGPIDALCFRRWFSFPDAFGVQWS
jgi:hypothetical protein